MALTRKLLKGMGLTDEQIESVIDAHTETVDGLKEQITQYKADAEKLAEVQKQLDEAKAKKDYKDEYEKAVKDLSDYKAEVAGNTRVPSGTVLIDNLPSYCCADIANRKGMAFQDMDRVERNGALGKPKNRDWACCRADGCRISRENVQKV